MSLERVYEIYSLFGWFYSCIALYAVALLIFSGKRKRFLQWIEKVAVVGIVSWTVLYAITTFSREIDRIQVNIQHVFAPFSEKIEYEHHYYSTYYLGFRPVLLQIEDRTTVRLIDVSIPEFFMARGYLYPAGILESGLHQVKPGDLVIASKGLVKDQKWIVLATVNDRSFAIASPDPKLYELEAELETQKDSTRSATVRMETKQ